MNARRSRLALTAIDALIVVVWTGLAVAASVWVVHASQTDTGEPFTPVERSFGILVLALVPITGIVAGRSSFRASSARVGVAVGLVWSYAAVVYGAAMFAEPSGDDNASTAGAGLVMLGIPLLVILALAMAIPAVLRQLLTRAKPMVKPPGT